MTPPVTHDHAERIRYLRARNVPWKEIARVLDRPHGSLRVLACKGRQLGGTYAGIEIVRPHQPLGLSNLPWRAAQAIRDAYPLPANRRTIWHRMYDGARRDEVRSDENIDHAVHRVRTVLAPRGVAIRNRFRYGWFMDSASAARFDELLAYDRLTGDQVTEGTR